jgi:hypothetical protein
MHHASFNGALIVKPSWGLIGELTLDDDGMRCWSEEKKLVLGTQDKESTLTPWSNYPIHRTLTAYQESQSSKKRPELFMRISVPNASMTRRSLLSIRFLLKKRELS